MQVTVVIRPSATEERTGEGADYEGAKAAALAQVPDGYDVISIRKTA